MQNLVGTKVLVTTEGWFYGRDGKQYKAVHGTLKGIHEASKTLGFAPNRTHANWYLEVGEMFIAGCQVMYVCACEWVDSGRVQDWSADGQSVAEYERPSAIYVTD